MRALSLLADRKLELTYQRGDDCIVKRLVDPLGLVAKGSIWYLIAGVEGTAQAVEARLVAGVGHPGRTGKRHRRRVG